MPRDIVFSVGGTSFDRVDDERGVAQVLPVARVFEAMRTVPAGGPAPWGELGVAFALDGIYIAAAAVFCAPDVPLTALTLRRRGYVTRYV